MSRNGKSFMTNSASSSKRNISSEPVPGAQDNNYYLKYKDKCRELHKTEMENLGDKYLKLEQSREKYRNRLSNENDQREKLLLEMKVIQENNQYFQYENNNLEKEIRTLINQKKQNQSSRDKEYETYQQNLRETKVLEEKNTKLEEINSQLKRENYELKSKCSVLLKVSHELDLYHSKYDEKCQELKNLYNNYQKLEISCEKSSENDSYRFKYDEINQEVEKLKTEKEILFKDCQNSEMKRRKYKENYYKLRNENDQQKRDLQEFEEDLKSLQNNYEKQSTKLKKYKENYYKLRNENDQQKRDLQDLNSKFVDFERTHSELEMNSDDLKSEHQKLKHTNSNTDKDDLSMTSYSSIVYKVEALENENKNAFKKIDELEAEIQKKQNAIVTIRNKYRTLQSTNDELSGLTVFKAQSLSLQKQNEDFKCQLNILTKSNENLNTNLELIKKENNQLKAEIKNMKLLKFSSKPISSISTNNIQDSYNHIDKNEMLQVKNEHSTQSFVNNEAELSNKKKYNINLQENKHKFPEWWYSHMHDEISTVQKKSTMNENVKWKAMINDTRSLITSEKSILYKRDDYSGDSFKSLDTNKNSTQAFADIVDESNNKDKMFPNTETHSNIYPEWWSNHIVHKT